VGLNYKVTNLFPSSIHRLGIDNFDDYKDWILVDGEDDFILV